MSWVSIDALQVNYGSRAVLDGVTLQVEQGSMVAVLGPSGCGKTTLLRSIAGLLPVSGGSITIGSRQLSGAGTTVPPERRGIGWVPQDASLFPNLSVGENIGFGLRRGPQRAPRIAELARLVGLAEYVDRSSAQLSGGQSQRVALARALAPRPDVVLLDEPFAALDPLLRRALRSEVAEVLRGQGSTVLLVTHDQEEALTLADSVAVMMGGRIVQLGTPHEVYEQPATLWVARFVGDTVELPGVWRGGRVSCGLGDIDGAAMDDVADGDAVRVMLRPEWVRLDTEGVGAEGLDTEGVGAGGVEAEVLTVAYAGHDALVTARLASGDLVRSRMGSYELPTPGDRVRVTLRRRGLVYR